ncbi:MAG: hypothetical protein QM541_16775 [Flavobacterium sp.]|nr:hypothetical protein [Flavobacterium sp.]
MKKTVKIILFGLLFLPFFSFGQNNCSFKIDTTKILTKENLRKFATKLKNDTFQSFTDINEIPTFIKKQLNCLTNGFSIANPNEDYRCCCTSPRHLPNRKLIFVGKSKNVLAMTYLTGGFGVSTHLLLIQFENNKIIDLWTGYCPSYLTNLAEILNHIEERNKKKSDFDSNIIVI